MPMRAKKSITCRESHPDDHAPQIKQLPHRAAGQHERAECRFRTVVCHTCGKQELIARVCRCHQQETKPETQQHNRKRPPGQNRVEYCSGRYNIQCTGVQCPIKEKIQLKLQVVPCSMELDTGSA
ncbi:hypothetical protein E2320_007025, partial [Naja naja]